MHRRRWGSDLSLESERGPLQFGQLHIGRTFLTSACFGYAEMDQFAVLSGDHSAIHTNQETAMRFGFPDRVQYGFLLSALLSKVVGMYFEHAVCAAVSIDFVKPAVAGQPVDVRAEVTQVQDAMRSVVLKVSMLTGNTVLVRGKLTVVFLAG